MDAHATDYKTVSQPGMRILIHEKMALCWDSVLMCCLPSTKRKISLGILNEVISAMKMGWNHWWSYERETHMMASWRRAAFHITGPLWGESTDDQWIPLIKGQ